MSISDKNFYKIGSQYETCASLGELDYKIIGRHIDSDSITFRIARFLSQSFGFLTGYYESQVSEMMEAFGKKYLGEIRSLLGENAKKYTETLSETGIFNAKKYSEAKKILIHSEKTLYEGKVRKAIVELSTSWTPCEKEIVENKTLELPYGIENVEAQVQNIYQFITEKRNLILTENFPIISRQSNQTITILSQDSLELKLIHEWFINYVSESPYHRSSRIWIKPKEIAVHYTYNPTTHITDFPFEVLLKIFQHMDSKTLVAFAAVGRQYRIWAEDAIAKRIENHAIKLYEPMLPFVLRNKQLKLIRLIPNVKVKEKEFDAVKDLDKLNCLELYLSFGIGLNNIVKLVSISPQLKILRLPFVDHLNGNKFALGTNNFNSTSKSFIEREVKSCLTKVFTILAKNKTIEELDFIRVYDRNFYLKDTLVHVEHLESLKVVRMSSVLLKSEADYKAFSKLTQLTKLYLDGGIEDLSFLKNFTKLEELHLSNSWFTNNISEIIPELIKLFPHLNSLHTLSIDLSFLAKDSYSREKLENLVLAFAKMKCLKNFSLKVQIHNFPIAFFINKLIGIPNLETFYFDGSSCETSLENDLTLSSDLNIKSNLKDISIKNCKMYLPTFTKMLNIFPSLPNLEKLSLIVDNINSNYTSETLTTRWNQKLPYLIKLKNLNLRCSFFKMQDNARFLSPLQELKELEELSLSALDIPEDKIRAIVDNFAQLPKIKKIMIGNISCEDLKADTLKGLPFISKIRSSFSAFFPTIIINLEKVSSLSAE